MTLATLLISFALQKADPIDAFVDAQMKAQHIPGLALLVVKDGKVIKEQAYGVSNVDKKTPVKTTDRFDIGSIGKTFTATLIIQAYETLKLKIDQPVKDFIPDFPDKWKGITIRHLLSHQSGLPDYALVPGVGLNDTYDQKTWKDTMFKLDLDFPTGRMYQYSNTNFVLLGMILEKIYEKPYREIVQERIFTPLGLKDTGFKEAGKGLPAGSATGYFFIDDKLQDAGLGGVSPTPSDGGEFSTIYDLRKWADGVRKGRIIRSNSVRQMQVPSKVTSGRSTGYGLGWMTNKIEGHRQITHGGNSVGFSGTLSTFPDDHIEIYMLCNLYPVGGDGFAAGIAKLLSPELNRKPQISTTDPHPDLSAKLALVLLDLGKKDIKSPRMHEDMQARLATGRGQMALPAYANFTEAPKMEFISEHEEAPDKVIRYRVNDGKASWIVDFQVTSEGTVYQVGKSVDLDKK